MANKPKTSRTDASVAEFPGTKRLSDIDRDVLRTLIKDGFDRLNGRTVTPAPD
jgi:hypothetical protein